MLNQEIFQVRFISVSN